MNMTTQEEGLIFKSLEKCNLGYTECPLCKKPNLPHKLTVWITEDLTNEIKRELQPIVAHRDCLDRIIHNETK